MRMRKKKNLDARLERVSSLRVDDPAALRGRWREVLYPEARALHLEVGCGKGRFLTELARRHPDILFVGVERVSEAVLMAMEKALDVPNIRFCIADIADAPLYWSLGEVDRIYLNFSDPWKKSKQAKRRLTHEGFLKLYREILVPSGEIFFKTDNLPLFEFSLKQFAVQPFTLSRVTRDLHGDPDNQPPEDVMTEYEERFVSQGVPICRLEARLKSEAATRDPM